ncbi:CPBP family intramembrane metalloprotease [Pseudomonas cichorii]|uniref:CPBP family intramembrane glutamic endopeptidase n=1 Tax=Pseudomonas cichorii TaxID=36746 RepID=UPI0018E63A92|nr:type II CAAX endopeptidase family protein [Pseudomonas cichorii]MBI6853140.1 CPBP family intramembrane metalloprotease [Pseudomonas cichorii]
MGQKNKVAEASREVVDERLKVWMSAVLAVLIFYGAQLAIVDVAGPDAWNALWMMGGLGIAGVMLLLLALLQVPKGRGVGSLKGQELWQVVPVGAVLITLAYVIAALWDVALGGISDPGQSNILHDLPSSGWLLFVLMLLIFPALAEELLYRHFLFRLFPLARRSARVAAVLVTSALFMWAHGDYPEGASFALMGCLGIILGTVRSVSGGLLAPLLLHSYAVGLSFALDFSGWGI